MSELIHIPDAIWTHGSNLAAVLKPGPLRGNNHCPEGSVYDVEVTIHEVAYWREDNKPFLEPKPLLTGFVKWDGCSNWGPGEAINECMWHGCARGHLTNLGALLGMAWDAAGKLMPDTWCGEK